MNFRFCAAALGLALISPADGAVLVLGNGNARMCYEFVASGGNFQRALAYCDAALNQDSLSERDHAATLVNRGIVRMKQHHMDDSIANFDAALEINPDLAEAYVNKGIAMVNAGNDAQAIALLTKGIELKTTKPEIAYYGRAVAHELSGHDADAYRDYRAASEIRPQWSEPREQLKRFSVVRTAG